METKFSFFKLTLLSILASIMITFMLLLEYTIEYHAPAILSGRIIIPFIYIVFILLTPLTVSVFFNSKKIFNTVFKITAVFMFVLILIGGFAKFKYSPQGVFLREFNLGGRTEKIIFKNAECKMPDIPQKAFLIYKGSHFFYYETKNSVIGINKDCLFDQMF